MSDFQIDVYCTISALVVSEALRGIVRGWRSRNGFLLESGFMSQTRFRFSLADLMVATLIVGIVVAIMTSLRPVASLVAGLGLAFAVVAMLIIGAIIGSGYRWAFCVGALPPSVILPLYVTWAVLTGSGDVSYLRWICLTAWGYCITSGCFGCLAFWLIKRGE